MKKLKNKKVTVKVMKVKTGTVKEFFANAREVMREADKGKAVKARCATLTFVEPAEMLHFLSAAKIKLINSIRNHPDSITNIAKVIKRTYSAVRRDIHEMESVGIVKTHEEINPAGHGKHKIVELVASTLKLEAYI